MKEDFIGPDPQQDSDHFEVVFVPYPGQKVWIHNFGVFADREDWDFGISFI
jgi:hypothetical protein